MVSGCSVSHVTRWMLAYQSGSMIRIGHVAGNHLTRSADVNRSGDVDRFHEFTEVQARPCV